MVEDPLPKPVAHLLLRLRNQLEEEYGGSVPPDMIDRVAEQSLRDFQEARVREFVPVFAWRRARQRLQRTG
jgi:hypothetical protein